MITCLTISERAWGTADLPRSIRHINVVTGVELSVAELHRFRLDAIGAVDTDGLFFQDIEDPLPSLVIPVSKNAGMLCGPIKLLEYQDGVGHHRHYSPGNHHVVRAILDTKKAQAVAKRMPQGHYDTFVLVHHFLEKVYGLDFNRSLSMVHRQTPTRANGLDPQAIRNSQDWIRTNEARICESLGSKYG